MLNNHFIFCLIFLIDATKPIILKIRLIDYHVYTPANYQVKSIVKSSV